MQKILLLQHYQIKSQLKRITLVQEIKLLKQEKIIWLLMIKQ